MRPAGRNIDGREALRLARERVDPERAAELAEAAERYADDEDGSREIADIQAGLHPLQRGGRNLDAWPSFEAKLAAIRARAPLCSVGRSASKICASGSQMPFVR